MTDPILLTAQLIEHRDDLKRILGSHYPEQVGMARSILRGVSAKCGISLATATLSISKQMDAAGVSPSLMLAAFVDETQESAK